MKIAITGVAGRMGRTLARIVHETDGCEVAGGLEQPGSDALGQDIGVLAGVGDLGVRVTDDPLELFTRIDGILDFTVPAASVEFAALAAQARIVHVVGTTGFTEEQDETFGPAGRHARIVKAGNMSLGVNLLMALVRRVASALDEDFDIEVLEMHHRNKIDAPSGTALMLGQAAADGRGVELNDKAVRARDGITGARERGDIGFATLRGGSVVGEHQVLFAGGAERLTLGHISESRDLFAQGAVKAALWAEGQKPGLYSMQDVLGLTDF